MKHADEDGYRQFVTARLEPLRVTAYLLCHNWHTADDLVSITIGKLYRHWRRVSAMENLDAYVRGMLTNAWLDERRRPWRRERSTDDVPDRTDAEYPEEALADREHLLVLLSQLPPRRRAVIVLRFWCDLVRDAALRPGPGSHSCSIACRRPGESPAAVSVAGRPCDCRLMVAAGWGSGRRGPLAGRVDPL